MTATRPATAPEIRPSSEGLPFAAHSMNSQARAAAAVGDEGVHHRERGEAGGLEVRAGVEAEPAHPEQGRADHGQRQRVRRQGFLAVADALAEHDAAHQAGDAGIDVHDRAAAKSSAPQA